MPACAHRGSVEDSTQKRSISEQERFACSNGNKERSPSFVILCREYSIRLKRDVHCQTLVTEGQEWRSGVAVDPGYNFIDLVWFIQYRHCHILMSTVDGNHQRRTSSIVLCIYHTFILNI